jgi:hypothetical protein
MGANRRIVIRMRYKCSSLLRRLLYNTDVDDHVVDKVLIPGNECCPVFVLEADAFGTGWSRVETVEVLHSSYDGVGGVVGIYPHTHRQPRRVLGGVGEQKFKRDVLRRDGLSR